MTPSPLNEEEVFHIAAALSAGERDAYLNTICRDDTSLRRRIDKLLGVQKATAFMPSGYLAAQPEAADEPMMENSGDRIGRYALLEQLGEGGFGVVWLAEQKEPVARRVALKILKPGMDSKEVLARFGQERQALAMMDHPAIAKMFDAGMASSGRPYFVMELARGMRITDYCNASGASLEERLRLFVLVCEAVQHAHQKGIVHRDIKPSNVLVILQDGVAFPKVIDFGVAKALQSRLTDMTLFTGAQQVLGTPAYMSPEQAQGNGLDIDTRTDIYSLGVLLFELLTSRLPFGSEILAELGMSEFFRIIREQDAPRLSTVVSTLGDSDQTVLARQQQTTVAHLIRALRGDLDWIVLKALEKDRSRRYDTASALALDVQRSMEHKPVLARPPSKIYRTKRFVKRHRIGVLTATGAAIAVVAGGSAAIWQGSLARAALKDLRNTAPAFAAQARELMQRDDARGAIDTLGYAIRLQPETMEYRRSRAVLLATQLRLEDAIADLRQIIAAAPGDSAASAALAACERAVASNSSKAGLQERLAELYALFRSQQRPPSELLPLARAIGREGELMRDLWLGKLRELPNATTQPIESRLTVSNEGMLQLDLSGMRIADLSPIKTMPLGWLNLSSCPEITSLEPLRELPLRTLHLRDTQVRSIASLSGMQTLTELTLANSPISDLGPLRGLKLQNLRLSKLPVLDLSPVETLPLRTFECGSTSVQSYEPLRKLPLERLILEDVSVGDLSFVREMPLKVLSLAGSRDCKDLAALNALAALETLVLPGNPLDLLDIQIGAIDALRKHPRLARISYSLAPGARPESAEPASVFWPRWEQTLRWFRPLRAVSMPMKTVPRPDGTWLVSIQNQPLASLSMFAGSNVSLLDVGACRNVSDLSPLRDVPLTTLSISHTTVSDLTPLRETQLINLWMADTKVADLGPLRGTSLKRIFMDKNPQIKDVTALLEIPSLEEILLPESAERVEVLRSLPNLKRISYSYDDKIAGPSTATADFWREHQDLAWLRKLRGQTEKMNAYQLANGTWQLGISDPMIGDVAALRGARISALRLDGTGVSDLRPLAGLPLRILRLDGTPCKDVSPLLEIPTLEHIVVPRGAENLAKLRALPALRKIAFECDASGSPTLDAAVFFRALAESSGR